MNLNNSVERMFGATVQRVVPVDQIGEARNEVAQAAVEATRFLLEAEKDEVQTVCEADTGYAVLGRKLGVFIADDGSITRQAIPADELDEVALPRKFFFQAAAKLKDSGAPLAYRQFAADILADLFASLNSQFKRDVFIRKAGLQPSATGRTADRLNKDDDDTAESVSKAMRDNAFETLREWLDKHVRLAGVDVGFLRAFDEAQGEGNYAACIEVAQAIAEQQGQKLDEAGLAHLHATHLAKAVLKGVAGCPEMSDADAIAILKAQDFPADYINSLLTMGGKKPMSESGPPAASAETLEEFKKMGLAQYRAMMKSRRRQTTKERLSNRKRRMAYRRSKSRIVRKKRIYVKRFARRAHTSIAGLSNARESVDVEVMHGPLDELEEIADFVLAATGYDPTVIPNSEKPDESELHVPADLASAVFDYLNEEINDVVFEELIGNPAKGKEGKIKFRHWAGSVEGPQGVEEASRPARDDDDEDDDDDDDDDDGEPETADCKGCGDEFPADELDDDGYCEDCAEEDDEDDGTAESAARQGVRPFDEEEGGRWVTTKSGHRIFIDGGEVTKGNPHVVAAAAADADEEEERKAAEVSDKALDAAYHYGLSKPGTFGHAANRASASFALRAIKSGKTDIEAISDAIHRGWSSVAKTYDDPVYAEKPQKRESRMALASKDYADLPDDEKEKDRVVARALLKHVQTANETIYAKLKRFARRVVGRPFKRQVTRTPQEQSRRNAMALALRRKRMADRLRAMRRKRARVTGYRRQAGVHRFDASGGSYRDAHVTYRRGASRKPGRFSYHMDIESVDLVGGLLEAGVTPEDVASAVFTEDFCDQLMGYIAEGSIQSDDEDESVSVRFPEARLNEFITLAEKAGVDQEAAQLAVAEGYYTVQLAANEAAKIKPFFIGSDVTYSAPQA